MAGKHESALVISAIVLVAGASLLGFSIMSTAIGGMRFGGDLRLWWGDEPVVLLAEVLLAGCAVAVAVGSIWRMQAARESIGSIVGWLGVGTLGLGAVSLAAAWVGLQVPSPGIDMLERGEMWYVIGGVPAVVIGFIVAIGGFAVASLSTADRG